MQFHDYKLVLTIFHAFQGSGAAVVSTSAVASRSTFSEALDLVRLREEVNRLKASGEKFRVEREIAEDRHRQEANRWKASYDQMRAEKGVAEARYADAAEIVRKWTTYLAEVENEREAVKAELALSRVALAAPVERGAAAMRAQDDKLRELVQERNVAQYALAVSEEKVRELTRERDVAFAKAERALTRTPAAAPAEHGAAASRARVAEDRVRELTRERDAAFAKAASAENALAKTAVPMEQGATARRAQIAEARAQELMRERDAAVAREFAARDALARAPSSSPSGVAATRAGTESASRLLGLLRTHLGGEQR